PHEPTRTASTTPARAPIASSFDQPAPPAQYRLATSAPSKTRRKVRLTDPRPSFPSLTIVDPNEGRLVILSGRRIAERSGGYDLADTVGSVPLAGGARAPSFAGGGFVFWTRQGLYRSQ